MVDTLSSSFELGNCFLIIFFISRRNTALNVVAADNVCFARANPFISDSSSARNFGSCDMKEGTVDTPRLWPAFGRLNAMPQRYNVELVSVVFTCRRRS